MSRLTEDISQNYKLMLISDVHLRDPKDLRYDLLMGLLDSVPDLGITSLVFLGDVFDFCFGASHYFREKFFSVGEVLSRLADRGISVMFMQGNHEFFPEHLRWRGVHFVSDRDLTILLKDSTALSLTHGDRIFAPWHYHLYHRLSRSFLFHWGGLLCPQAQLDRLCLKISARSRIYSEDKDLNHKQLMHVMRSWLSQRDGSLPEAQNSHFGIFGHFHIPYDFQAMGETPGRLLCLKSWDTPNYLLYVSGRCERYEYDAMSGKFFKVNAVWNPPDLKPFV
ncbi:MAG: metallophosphoesterase [Deltaproteobacteria bacterium]|nr:metallophosphoesterase [Deltaproteobacteria bacterium]